MKPTIMEATDLGVGAYFYKGNFTTFGTLIE